MESDLLKMSGHATTQIKFGPQHRLNGYIRLYNNNVATKFK